MAARTARAARTAATANTRRTNYSTSGYRGGRKAMTDQRTGSAGRGNRYISRRQQYYDVRVGLGLSGG